MVHPTDAVIFWTALYITPLIWIFFAFTALTSPQWLLIVAVAITLSGANVAGYWRCQKDAKKRIQMFIAQRL